MQNFKAKVISIIKKIPKGKVASYGQVAAAAGSPRAARQVGGVLKSIDCEKLGVPWWRVINSKGEISIKGNWTADKKTQKELLEREGVKVLKDFKVDMKDA